MAHIGKGIGIVISGAEHHNVVAVDGFGLAAVFIGAGGSAGNIGHIAGLAGIVGDPVRVQGVDLIVGNILGSVGSGRGVFRVHRQCGNGSIEGFHGGDAVGQGLGGFLGGLGSGSLLLRGGFRAFVILFDEAIGVQIVVVVGVRIVLLGILGIGCTQLVIGVGQGIAVVLLIVTGKLRSLVVCTQALLGSAAAVHGLDIGIHTGIAVSGGVRLHGFHGAVNFLGGLFGQGVAVGVGFIDQRIDCLGIVNSGMQEVVSPGFAAFLVENLLIQGLGQVQTEDTGIAAILAVEFIHSVNIEVVQLCIADLMLTDGQGNGIALADAAVGNGSADRHIGCDQDQGNQNHHSQSGVKLQLLRFLLLGQLLFGQLLSLLSIAELFLAGCTHSSSFPLIYPNEFITQPENCG